MGRSKEFGVIPLGQVGINNFDFMIFGGSKINTNAPIRVCLTFKTDLNDFANSKFVNSD